MRYEHLLLATAGASCVARGFGEGNQGYNYDGTYYRVTYSSGGARLTTNNFGTFNPTNFAFWMGNTKCIIGSNRMSGEVCAKGAARTAFKDAAQVSSDTGDKANIIGFRNESWSQQTPGQTGVKSYVLSNQGQGPSVSGPENSTPPQTCDSAQVEHNAGGNLYYPNVKGIKVTCKTACGTPPMLDSNLNALFDQFWEDLKVDGSFMAQYILWSSDTSTARVRCRLTIADRWQDVDTCPDFVPSKGCTINAQERRRMKLIK
ncbi:hypothetical protein BDZ85DRAFT_59447 [Elsinoe ampelina]|uniref:Uncharacterized protein n=1 Tax=Elsinoe ampelina TaxID=302913 RepID=A0A6A6G070_9PEZI|nr:hypothetical protein BDZ85DRAFT_59447 [Elsinoe ampelina]